MIRTSPMKIARTVGAVLLLAAAAAGALFAQTFQGPKLTVSEIKFDFGRVVQGTEVTHIFDVRNTGTEPLVIERVVPS
jgi:uncharacterized protein (DUF58 family)